MLKFKKLSLKRPKDQIIFSLYGLNKLGQTCRQKSEEIRGSSSCS